MTDEELIVLAGTTLTFNLIPKFRMISLDVDEKNKIIEILIIITEPLTDDEKDIAYSFSSEFEGHFPVIMNDVIDFIVDNNDIKNLPRKRLLIHAFYK